MINSSIFNKLFFALSVVFLASCDNDFNELGSSIIEDDIHHDNITRIEAGVTAFDKATGAVQSNNLPINSIGFYKNPAFGTTTAHFVSQVKLNTLNPQFTTNVEIDTVYFYVPYFTKSATNNSDGTTTYELDSIKGNTNASMRLNVYENRFFLRDTDPSQPNLTEQKYFSDQLAMVHNERNPVRLNDNSNPLENDAFKISASQIQRKKGDGTVIERFAPGIFLHLNKAFFQGKIINSPGKLINQTVFKEWFRGLYFNVEPTGDDGAMAALDWSKGKVVIIYKQDKVAGIEGTVSADRVRNTLELNMAEIAAVSINTVNFFENNYSPAFSSGIATTTAEEASGENRLFIKGGQGSVAYIDINTSAFSQYIINSKVQEPKIVVNEANLTFYVDQSSSATGGMKDVAKDDEPLRVYLYDLKNKRPIYDYYLDATANTLSPKFNKNVHGGIIEREGGKGRRYKLRLTHHINNIINHDSTNVRLALVVSENINFIGNAALKSPINFNNGTSTDYIPAASVISPTGTVLFGNNIPVGDPNYDKRLKLEIFYTKPN